MLIPGLMGTFCIYITPLAGIGWLFLNLFIFNIALMLSILPHEFGHAFVARYFGWRVFKIYLGLGKTLFKTIFFGFETEFRAIPLGGLVLAAPHETSHYRAKLFTLVLAGPFANLLLATITLAVMGGHLHKFDDLAVHLLPLQMFLIANIFVAFGNLWPSQVNTVFGKHPSDGRLIWNTLKTNPSQATQAHAAGFVLESTLCQEKKQYPQAQSWIEKGLALYPDNLHLLMAGGLNQLHLQQFNEARDYFVKALPWAEKQPLIHSIILNNIAYTNSLIGTPELMPEADRYSAEALAQLSWMPSIKGTRGSVLLELGRIDEALPFLREAMQTHDVPNNKAQNACWLAIAEIRNGNPEAGRKYLTMAREFDSTCFLLERTQKVLDGAKAESA